MEEADDRGAHTILIRDVRATPTTREKKVSSKATQASASLEEDALSRAFPLLQHESFQHQKARIQAFQFCWSSLSAHLKDVLDETTTSTFRELGAYAKAQHLEGANAAFGRHRLVPTALAVAGSMNSADHAGTFAALVVYLRKQGCHAGLLQHQDLAANKGISAALNSIMRQLSGLDTEACDMEALQAWHADEVAKGSPSVAMRQSTQHGQGNSYRSPAKRPKPSQGRQLQSPAKRRQVEASARTTRSRAAQQSAAHPAAGSSARELISDSEEEDIVVHLSDDDSTASDDEPAAASQPGPSRRREDTAGPSLEASQAAGGKPLVVVIENTEAADLTTLQDLILVLSEARAQLPITLVLGMSISVAALRHMLPVKAADVLQAKEFRLVQAKALLESIVREVLLGQRFHGLLFHHRLLDDLLHHFLSHDFSVTCIRRGLQVACLRHFQSEPLSVLLSATAESPEALAQACDRLPHALRSSIEGSAARQSIGKTVATWRAWAVSIRWLHEAAHALGMGHSAAFSLMSLYMDTLHLVYMFKEAIGQKRLRRLCDSLRWVLARMPDHGLLRPSVHVQGRCWPEATVQAVTNWKSSAMTGSDGLSLTSLYVDASEPAYMSKDAVGQKRLRSLCDKLEELSDDRCRQLLQALVDSSQQVAEGPQAIKDDLASVKSLLEEVDAASQDEASAAAATPQHTAQGLQPQGQASGSRIPPVTPAPARRESMSLASMLKKQKAPLSGAQRKQELLGGHAKGKEAVCTPEARGLGVRHQQKPRLAVRVAGVIQKAVSRNLADLPTSLAGAKALCCSAHAEVMDMMCSAPRWAVHQALAEKTPATYAARHAPTLELGLSPDMEDPAIAYRLLMEYGESVGVADWFQSFCAVFHTHAGTGKPEEATPSSQGSRRRGKMQQHTSSQAPIAKYMPGKRRGQQALSPILESAADEDAEVAEESAAPKTKGRGRPSEAKPTGKGKAKAAKTHDAVDGAPDAADCEPVEAVPLQDLAVRFSCATRELQFLGLIKEAPRSRKDGIVQRLAYPMRVQTA